MSTKNSTSIAIQKPVHERLKSYTRKRQVELNQDISFSDAILDLLEKEENQ